jgi:hypothetical protein
MACSLKKAAKNGSNSGSLSSKYWRFVVVVVVVVELTRGDDCKVGRGGRGGAGSISMASTGDAAEGLPIFSFVTLNLHE